MTTLDQIESDYRAAREKLDRLRHQIEEQKERVSDLKTALRVLSQYDGRAGASRLSDPDLGLTDAAEIVLQEAGEALSLADIVDRIDASDYPYKKDRETLRRSLSGVLSRTAKEDDGPVVKIRRGTYGLRGRDDVEEEEEKPSQAALDHLEGSEETVRGP